MVALRLARARVGAVTSAGRGTGPRAQWSSLGAGSRVLVSKSRSGGQAARAFVAMMESADFGQLDDLTHRRRLDVSRVGSVFVQGEVGSRALVVGEVGTQDAAVVCLA